LRSRSIRFSSTRSTKPSAFKDDFVSTEHLLLCIAKRRNEPAGQLAGTRRRHHDAILKRWFRYAAASASRTKIRKRNIRRSSVMRMISPDSARKGKLDPVIGRDEEIRRVMQVLSRRTKNNPVLIGEPGVR
jgi:ATP-dependent Clp protease ATP-binding subunit ClpB